MKLIRILNFDLLNNNTMDIILIRGIQNAGKTTAAYMTYQQLSKQASQVYLFDHYNKPLNIVQYDKNGDPFDFKAVLVINGKITVIITAGDEVWRLLINISFIIDFVHDKFKVSIDTLIACGRSSDRYGSAYERLTALYSQSKLSQVWVSNVDKSKKISEKQKAVNQIISFI